MATDLGLRIGDFINLKKSDLPLLNQEAPISFDIMTGKEDVIACGFLSQETAELLKIYLPTLEDKKNNPFLFPSNGINHISEEWLNRLLSRLTEKAKINLNNKKFTFHCFRKMFLSTAIDSGIGLTAGKKLVGKSIAKSDDTYLTTVNLRKKFVQIKKFLTIKEQIRDETENIEQFKQAIVKLQEDLLVQKTITDTITEKNLKIDRDYEEIRKLLPKQEKPPEVSEEEQKHNDEMYERVLEDQKYRKEHPEEFKIKPETEEERKFREEHEPQEYLDGQYIAHLEYEVRKLRQEQEKDKKRLKEIEKLLKIKNKTQLKSQTLGIN